MSKLVKISILLLQLYVAWGFSTNSRSLLGSCRTCSSSSSSSSSRISMIKTDQGDDFPPDESGDYEGSIDWDSEWKKVVANEGKLEGGQERPGKDFYKSEAEVAAIKAANKAAMKATEVSTNVSNSLPQFNSFTGDWKVSFFVYVSSSRHTHTHKPISDSSFFVGDKNKYMYSFGLQSWQLLVLDYQYSVHHNQ